MKKLIPIMLLYVSSMFMSGCNSEKISKDSFKMDYRTFEVEIVEEGNAGLSLKISDENSNGYILAELDKTYLSEQSFVFDKLKYPVKITYERDVNSSLKQMASQDSINKVFNEFKNQYKDSIWKENYERNMERYSVILPIKPDTLFRNSLGNPVALTDLNKDGVFEIMQHIGNRPGSYFLTTTIKDFPKKYNNKVVTQERFDSLVARLK